MAKRARTLTCDHLRSSSSIQAPSWGAKRARSGSALRDRSLPDSEWRDWSSIGNGPAWLISERVLAGDDVADYVSFRAVCRSWRQWTTSPRAHGPLDSRFHPRQWVMLRDELAVPDRRRFLNVSSGRCIQADLPELRGHRVFGPTAEGLLVLLDEATFAVRLLNPLTRQLTDLPPDTTLVVVAKLTGVPSSPRNLMPDPHFYRTPHDLYLVGNGGRLMVVHRSRSLVSNSHGGGRRSSKYSVHWVYFDSKRTVSMVVTRFRRQALFIGAYRAISVNPEAFPGISPDTVYPGFDCDDKPSLRQVDGGLDGSNVAFPHTAVDCLSPYNA
uniref:DUF295 domain-containing protein n=1 Tax=Oryza meridionalis TaxID=40149 RepID=A0A0E0EDN0_9ORYZ